MMKNYESVLYFSVLTDWVLHGSRALSLLPFWLTWREASYLLLVSGSATAWRSGGVAHHILVVQSSSLCDHVWEATSIGKHLVLIWASHEIVGNEAFILVSTCLLVTALATCIIVARVSLILSLTVYIDRWLRSYSVLCWCWTWFLGVTSLFRNHLTIKSMILIASQ